MPDRELVGKIDIDSGLIMIGDPIYDLEEGDLDQETESGIISIDHESGYPGKAIVINDLTKDETYPVYVIRNKNGQIRQVIIDLGGEE